MPLTSLAITGFGMTTSLGNGVAACTAQRAGMARAAPLKFAVDDPVAKEAVPVLGHVVGDLTRGFSEVGLGVRLASLALADLLARTPLEPTDFPGTAVLLNLGSGYYLQCVDEARAREAEQANKGTADKSERESLAMSFVATLPLYSGSIVNKVFRVLGLPVPSSPCHQVLFGDQSGVGDLILAADSLLQSKQVSACLVGGVDSLVEPRWLRACDELRLLKTPLRPIGLSPGEAGVFLLLEKSSTKRPPFAFLRACETARETVHRFSNPCPQGHALSGVVHKCIARVAGASDSAIICDLNGDDVRASDYGHALVRLQEKFRPRSTIIPAISFGDTRAASGFIGICLALRAFARGYASGNNFVVSSAGDDGGRTAVVVANN